MKPVLKHIDHINIVVNDLERVKAFFLALGFLQKDGSRLAGEWISNTVGLEDVDAEYVKLTLPGDRTSIELIQFRHPPPVEATGSNRANTPGLRHLAFEVTDIAAMVAALRQWGIEPVSSVQTYVPGNKKLVYFHGPEGILLELAQYGDENPV
jgi:catechol 2,3-dioxygenase-like lactoylglutathione lyase family enzyme